LAAITESSDNNLGLAVNRIIFLRNIPTVKVFKWGEDGNVKRFQLNLMTQPSSEIHEGNDVEKVLLNASCREFILITIKSLAYPLVLKFTSKSRIALKVVQRAGIENNVLNQETCHRVKRKKVRVERSGETIKSFIEVAKTVSRT